MGTINFGEVKTDSNNSDTQTVPAQNSTQGLDNLISNFNKKLDDQKKSSENKTEDGKASKRKIFFRSKIKQS